MKKAILMLCLLFAGCDEDELAVRLNDNIQAEDISQSPVGGVSNQVANQYNDVVTPEPSTLALMALCLGAMFVFSKLSYKYRDDDDLTTRGIDP